MPPKGVNFHFIPLSQDSLDSSFTTFQFLDADNIQRTYYMYARSTSTGERQTFVRRGTRRQEVLLTSLIRLLPQGFFNEGIQQIIKLLEDFGIVDRIWVTLGKEEVHVLDVRHGRCDNISSETSLS